VLAFLRRQGKRQEADDLLEPFTIGSLRALTRA
jgi:hypothetical protein